MYVINRFDGRLESLRGFAALIVASHHGLCAFVDRSIANDWSIRSEIVAWYCWITNPAASVVFFFVLSGYVLGGSIGANPGFMPYVGRRLFRIIPMFIFSVAFAYLSITLIRIDIPPDASGTFFRETFFPGPTLSDFADNLLMRSALVNGPSWSIYPELLGSLTLPLLVYAHICAPPKFRWALFALICTALAFSGLRLVLWFYIGYFLPLEVAKFVGNSRRLAVFTLAAGYLALLFAASNFPFSYSARFVVPTAVGAALMIGSILPNRRFLSWLDRDIPRSIGRVSYSFYLLHWPVFYLCWVVYMQTTLPRDGAGNLVLSFAAIVASLALSKLTYRWIELPAISVGRGLSDLCKRQRYALIQWPHNFSSHFKSGDNASTR